MGSGSNFLNLNLNLSHPTVVPMKNRFLNISLALLLITQASLLCPRMSLAAPGDFLFQWGRPQLLSQPSGVAVDGDGNLYVAQNHKVQIFDSGGSLVKSWGAYGAGNGQFQYPASVALAGKRLYVADLGNNRVQAFDRDGNFLFAWGSPGSGNGMLKAPQGLATDRTGNVYVADTGNNRVQVFDGGGNFIRSFGSQGGGNGEFSSPADLAVDGAGSIYVVDDHFRVQVFSSRGDFVRSWQSHRGTGSVEGIAVDAAGNVYLALTTLNESPSFRLRVFDGNGNFLREWGSFGSGEGQFFGFGKLAAGLDGTVYVADPGNDRVQRFDSGGRFLWKVGGGDGRQFNEPVGAATDSSGNIYVSDSRSCRVQVFDSGGKLLRKFGSCGAGNGQFANPGGLAVDGAGNVYVSDEGGAGKAHADSRVQVFDSGGNFLRSWGWPVDKETPSPQGLAIDSGGNLFLADGNNSQILAFGRDGIQIRSWSGLGTSEGELWSPTGLAVDRSGQLYVVDRRNHRVQVFASDGKFLRAWGSEGSGDGQFKDPRWVALDGKGHVYVTDSDGSAISRVQVFDGAGKFLGKWGRYGSGDGEFLSPAGVAASGGNVYVLDTKSNRLQAFEGYSGDPVPQEWATRDIGTVGVAGGVTYADGSFTLQGSGDDIWGAIDAFRFVYQPLNGDGAIVARVTSLQNTNTFAMGGVMIRETLTPNSPHAMMNLVAGYGAEFSRRHTAGGPTVVRPSIGVAPPYWVKLVREGNTFSGYIAKDGIDWILIDSATVDMASTAYIGLIVSSHNNSVLCKTTLEGVSLTKAASAPAQGTTAPAGAPPAIPPATTPTTTSATTPITTPAATPMTIPAAVPTTTK